MQITKEITIDLQRRGVVEPLEAVQCDANTRAVKVTLLNGGESWTPPAGAVVSVAFKKPDGTAGWYDKLPDEADACTVAGNTVTAIFAPQMLTAAGKVNAAVIFQDAKLNQLATFVFTVNVQANPAAGKGISNDYYKYSTMEQLSAAVDAWLTETEAEKNDFLNKADAALEAMRDVITTSDSATPIVCEESGDIISVSNSADRLLRGLTLYGKTTQNGTPTPTSPVAMVSVGASGNIEVTVAGKNMFPKASAGVLTESGITLTSNGDGSYSAKGTATSDVTLKFPLEEGVVLEEGMYLHCMNNASSDISFVYWYSDSTSSYWALIPANRISAPTKNFGKTITQIGINMKSGNTVDVTFSPMFMFSDKAMDFVPYQSIQKLTASTPSGLPGIPVTSGGNYTDENGQQWVCDEIDYAKGLYVKRIGMINGYSGESVPGAYMSVTGSLTSGAKIIYAVETPTEITLPAEEMAAYYALHSNNPNTVAYNDAGAGMKLGYVADTKLYIDNKFGELATALVNKT